MGNPFQAGTGTVTGGGTSRVYNVAASTAAGDTLLALAIVNNNTGSVSGLTDSKGNVYTLDTSFTGAFPNIYAFRSPGATGGSGGGPTAGLSSVTPDTWTLTTGSATANIELYAVDAGPVGILDSVSAIASGSSTTPSVTATPASNNEIAISMWGTANGGGAPAVNAPFTSLGSFNTGSNPFAVAAYDILAGGSGTPLTSTLTITSANWRGLMWLFKPGTTTESGPFNITLPNPATALAGSVQSTESGPFNITLPAPATSIHSIFTDSGPLNITLPGPATALAGTVQSTESGPLALVLPGPVTSLTGSVTVPGAVTVAGDTGGLTVGGLAGRPGRAYRKHLRRLRRGMM